MALVAVDAVVDVASHPMMVRIRLRPRVAVGAGKDQVIVGIRMAGGAHPIGVPMVHREECVIPIRGNPRSRVMASRASGRESGRDVIGTCRTVVIHFMTCVAGRRHRRVVVIHVATCARYLDVEAGQGKRRGIVVEAGRNPGCGVVTYLALLRES